MKMQKKFLTLALLLAATTAATAQTVTGFDSWSTGTSGSNNTFTGSFSQPAYDVEVTTELYYKLDATETFADNVTAYGSKTDFFLDRTLTQNVWNTFASPFAIASEQMEAYFGAGAKVRYLSESSVSDNVLTITFADATSIAAGKPYIVKPTAANVDFSADGKEFTGVDLSTTASADETTYVDFVPTLGKTAVTGNVKDILMMTIDNTDPENPVSKLVHPSAVGDMKGFRGYFVLHDAPSGARAYSINFGDDETTGIIAVEGSRFTVNDEPSTIYDLQGRKVENATKKGIYIQNGKKVVIK